MRRRKSTIFFVISGICLIALAVALNVGWILLNLQQIALLVFGIVFFALIITGLILNTTFLVREIRRNEQQDAFLNAMTHELKTPIASIKLYLETIKSREISEDKRREFYDVMLDDSDRLLHTVEQVLDASRTRERDRQLDIAKVHLPTLLGEAVQIVKTRHKLGDEIISVGEFDDAAVVSGDDSELRTVFTNLLDNAVKYSSKDDPKISVKMRLRTPNKVDVYIRDNGMGISSEEVSRVFKRFYRIKNEASQNIKGTGLGLYIVQSIVKKHRGKVIAKSKGPGLGSTFTVRLPLYSR